LAAKYLEKKTRRFRVESAMFLFTRRVLAFFRVNPAKIFNQPDFFLSGAPALIHRRVNLGFTRGNRKGGARKKSENRRVFFSRYLAANDGATANTTEGNSRVNPNMCVFLSLTQG